MKKKVTAPDTVLVVGTEVLHEGLWKKIREINPEFILLEDNIVVTKEDLIPKWDLTIQKDFSDPKGAELEIAIIKTTKDGNSSVENNASESKLVLFTEHSGIALTKYNIDQMTAIANIVKEYMNTFKIIFEKGKV